MKKIWPIKTEILFLKSKKKSIYKIKIIGEKSYAQKIKEYSKNLENIQILMIDLPKISPG